MKENVQQSYSRYKKYTTDLRRYYRIPVVQTSLSVVLSLFVVAFFILVAIRPTLITITKLNKTIEDSQKILDQLSKKSAALSQISNLWEEISPLQKYIDNSIPSTSPRYQELTKGVEILAVESGVKLTSLTAGEALTYSQIADPYSGIKRKVIEMPFTVRVSGDYLSVSSFLSKLIQIDRVVSIDSMTFSKDAKATGEKAGVALSITGKVSYLADEAILNTAIMKDK